MKKRMRSACSRKMAVLAFAVAAVAACGASTTPALARSSADAITIGQMISLTGPVATVCYDQVRGASVAIREAGRMKEKVNGKMVPYLGGVGVKVVTEDDQSVPAGGVTAFRALADSSAVALVGPCSSTVGQAFAPQVDSVKLPQIVSNAGGPFLVQPEYAFRAGIDETKYDGRVIQVLKGRGVKTVYLFEGTDNPQLVLIQKAVRATLKVLGIEVVGSYQSTLTNVNFTPALQQIQQLKPDAIGIYASGGAGQSLTEMTAARNAGLNQPFFGPRTLYTDSILKGGVVTKGTLFASAYSEKMTFPESVRFTKLFPQSYPSVAPSPIAAAGYDAMWRLLRAIHDIGPQKVASSSVSTARDLIYKALKAQKSARTAEGAVTYLPDGDVKGGGVVGETDGNGNVALVKVPSAKDLLKGGGN